MADYRGQHITISDVIPFPEIILGPDSLQYSLAIVERSRRAHFLRPRNDIEDNRPLLIRSRLAANDMDGKLLLTEPQTGEDSKGIVDILLGPNGLVDHASGSSTEEHQHSKLV
jgi:hypothetical protein